jgi:pimeloyl-ACP methyl ester carboxylesterase
VNPFFFGRSASPLFGAYDPPAESARDHGVVLCPAFGHEYLFAHPTYRLLARRLAADGHHVLRLDYHGTGDSAGDFEDASSAEWIDDIDLAINELKDLAGVSSVALVGLRYGGTLAARAARDRDDLDRLVLWDPVIDGRAFLSELGVRAGTTGETEDVLGFPLSAGMRAEIRDITVDMFQSSLPSTLVAVTAATADAPRALAAHLEKEGIEVSVQHTQDAPAWQENRPGTLALPTAAIQNIVRWLS